MCRPTSVIGGKADIMRGLVGMSANDPKQTLAWRNLGKKNRSWA
jgi:hypothetical protein